MNKCSSCSCCIIEQDPDPNDRFCDDDVLARCSKFPDPSLNGTGASCKKPYIAVACRPYRTKAETNYTPSWCPLLQEKLGN